MRKNGLTDIYGDLYTDLTAKLQTPNDPDASVVLSYAKFIATALFVLDNRVTPRKPAVTGTPFEKLNADADKYIAEHPPTAPSQGNENLTTGGTPLPTGQPPPTKMETGRAGYKQQVLALHKEVVKGKFEFVAELAEIYISVNVPLPTEGTGAAIGFDKQYAAYMRRLAELLDLEGDLPTAPPKANAKYYKQLGALYDTFMQKIKKKQPAGTAVENAEHVAVVKPPATNQGGAGNGNAGKLPDFDERQELAVTVLEQPVTFKLKVVPDQYPTTGDAVSINKGLLDRSRILLALESDKYTPEVAQSVFRNPLIKKEKVTDSNPPLYNAPNATKKKTQPVLLREDFYKFLKQLIESWNSAVKFMNTLTPQDGKDAPEEQATVWVKCWREALEATVPPGTVQWSVNEWQTALGVEEQATLQKKKTAAEKVDKLIKAQMEFFDKALRVYVGAKLHSKKALKSKEKIVTGGCWSDDDEEEGVGGGSGTEEEEEEEEDEEEGNEGGGKPHVWYEPSVRRVLMSMLLADEWADAHTCAGRLCRRDFSRCRFQCLPSDRQLLEECAEAELRRLVHSLHPLLRRAR